VGLVLSRRGAHSRMLRVEVAWHAVGAVGAWWIEAGRGARGWGFEGVWEVRTGTLGVWEMVDGGRDWKGLGETGRDWEGLGGTGRDWEGLGVTGTGGEEVRHCGD
jgi:hypothetical protein